MPLKAIKKLESEMTQNNANPYIQVVGGFLLQHLEVNPQDAEKILATDKTISKSLDEMWKDAKKKQSHNLAIFTPQEGFEIVMKYFGIEATAPTATRAVPTSAMPDRVIQSDVSSKPAIDFDIKLEDLF
ncbi:hypothetical protein [Desulfosporosinus nitroreducens]|uniref:hypothetical protein n=1 Tax=Desulfosporosinus nitroreducens TaxID=2018668 RepID=UPI00207C4524|nr:hypothetical protein [Desulfosporosinus nitroreducens]MCO1599780.1 hypothetical protein [Desulfosporosinus nitroreducens]